MYPLGWSEELFVRHSAMRYRLALLLTSLLCMAGAANAHHSFAMFDASKPVTLKATVRKVEFMNPHIFLFVDVPGKSGLQQWMVECGSVNQMTRVGWKANTIKPGDKVTVTINPLRNGQQGGALKSVTLANGTVIEG